MHRPRIFRGTATLAFAISTIVIASIARADLAFTPGNYYTSTIFSRVITEYDASGNLAGSYTLPSSIVGDLRGMAFGPDGLLYAAVSRGGAGFVIIALSPDGAVQEQYFGGVYLAGNSSFGKIALDQNYIYICGQNELTRFTRGQPLAGPTVIYTGGEVWDVKPLPNGNLWVTAGGPIDEITTDGVPVQQIGMNGPHGEHFVGVRGLDYDPFTGKLFAFQFGDSSFFFQLVRVDPITGALEKYTSFTYGEDVLVDLSGNVIVGSDSLVPTTFNAEFAELGHLGTAQQSFLTRYVPWPTVENLPTEPVVAEATGPTGAVVTFPSPTSSDLEGHANLVVNQPASGSIFPLGSSTVSSTAIDRRSHTTSRSFEVVVQDTTAPTIATPALRLARTRTKSGANVNFNVSAFDLVDGVVPATAQPPSGAFFPVGDTVVTVTATDSRGNQASTSFTVSVRRMTKRR